MNAGSGSQVEALLSIDEAASVLKVKPGWLAKAALRGDVPSRKIGRERRFTPSDLNAYIEASKSTDSWARSTRSQAKRRRAA